MSTRIGPERGLTRWLRGHLHSISMLDEPAMRELCARVRAWCQVQATGAGQAWARRLLSMAATPLSCFRWRPRPFRSRQLPPAIVVELKLHRSTLLWRLRAASFVAAEGAAEWEARWCTFTRSGESPAASRPEKFRGRTRPFACVKITYMGYLTLTLYVSGCSLVLVSRQGVAQKLRRVTLLCYQHVRN